MMMMMMIMVSNCVSIRLGFGDEPIVDAADGHQTGVGDLDGRPVVVVGAGQQTTLQRQLLRREILQAYRYVVLEDASLFSSSKGI